MNKLHPASLCIVLLGFLLGACGENHRFEPPIAKTNPKPTQRYEITVELFDPPTDIKSIVGAAHFSIPDVICMPTPDRIAGYTPGSSYIKEFSLERIDENIYQGHVFLDWPIDEDYYGLGVCKWEIDTVGTIIDFGEYKQKPVLWSGTDFPSAGRKWWCRRPDSKRILDNCTAPSDPVMAERESQDSYLVVLSSARK